MRNPTHVPRPTPVVGPIDVRPLITNVPLTFAQLPHVATDLSDRAYKILGVLHRGFGGFRKGRDVIDLTDAKSRRGQDVRSRPSNGPCVNSFARGISNDVGATADGT